MNNLEPQYFGKNIIRYENFLYDYNYLLTNEDFKWDNNKALSYLVKKYDMVNITKFNSAAYSFLYMTYYMYHKKYLSMVNNKESNFGVEEKDLNLLRYGH